jgi:hypothetical protein
MVVLQALNFTLDVEGVILYVGVVTEDVSMGQPEVIFISLRGLWKGRDLGSGWNETLTWDDPWPP